MCIAPLEAASLVSNLCNQTHHSTLQAGLTSQVFAQRGLATETDVLCADYWLAFPELSRLLKFPESPCAMLINGISRQEASSQCWASAEERGGCTDGSTLTLLPKETRSSWSRGGWEQKESASICCECKKCQRHNGEARDRNKTNGSLLSIVRLDRTQSSKA